MNAWDAAIIALILLTVLGLLFDLLVRLFGAVLKEYDMLEGKRKKVVIWIRKRLRKK